MYVKDVSGRLATLIDLGECAIFAQLWPLLMLLPTLLYVNGVVVPFEEAPSAIVMTNTARRCGAGCDAWDRTRGP